MSERPQWIADALQDATVTVLCSPADLARVQAWVAQLPASQLYRVRPNPFVPDGAAYAWQPDGLLAPRAVHPVWVAG